MYKPAYHSIVCTTLPPVVLPLWADVPVPLRHQHVQAVGWSGPGHLSFQGPDTAVKSPIFCEPARQQSAVTTRLLFPEDPEIRKDNVVLAFLLKKN